MYYKNCLIKLKKEIEELELKGLTGTEEYEELCEEYMDLATDWLIVDLFSEEEGSTGNSDQ